MRGSTNTLLTRRPAAEKKGLNRWDPGAGAVTSESSLGGFFRTNALWVGGEEKRGGGSSVARGSSLKRGARPGGREKVYLKMGWRISRPGVEKGSTKGNYFGVLAEPRTIEIWILRGEKVAEEKRKENVIPQDAQGAASVRKKKRT